MWAMCVYDVGRSGSDGVKTVLRRLRKVPETITERLD